MANYNYPNYYMGNPYMQNPMLSQQNRLQSMENQFFGNNQQSQQNNLVLKGRPVTSFDEAKASMIDLDGSVFIFPDYASGKIYTKQINMDGTASIRTYELVNPMNMQQSNQANQGANERYLKQCYYNLQEKYDCGGISKEEWMKVYKYVNFALDLRLDDEK